MGPGSSPCCSRTPPGLLPDSPGLLPDRVELVLLPDSSRTPPGLSRTPPGQGRARAAPGLASRTPPGLSRTPPCGQGRPTATSSLSLPLPQLEFGRAASEACPVETRPFSYCAGINKLPFKQNPAWRRVTRALPEHLLRKRIKKRPGLNRTGLSWSSDAPRRRHSSSELRALSTRPAAGSTRGASSQDLA
jgi:hypothetical protein